METGVITILNKLPRKDSATGLDVWYKKVLNKKIPYRTNNITDINGTNVSMGQTYTILIPFDELYLPYNDWKKKTDSGYTISLGDYIFLGVEVTEDITPNNIQSIRSKYEPNVCEVRSITEVNKRSSVNYRLKIEGV